MVATGLSAPFVGGPGEAAEDVVQLRRENAALKDRDLRQCRELADMLRDLKSLSYSVSHDLRAPLRAIDGFSQILDEDFTEKLGDEGRRLIHVIRDNCRAMDQLTGALAEYLRAWRTGEPVHSAAIDMTALATAAAREVTSLHPGGAPCINISGLPAVRGDRVSLGAVWCNLIGNAVKFSAKRSDPKIWISGQTDRNEAAYRIQDNGVGFDLRYADRLFGVFQRLHKPDEFFGTGIGLAIVQRVVLRHGGRVWAEGATGGGACFGFALPLAAASDSN